MADEKKSTIDVSYLKNLSEYSKLYKYVQIYSKVQKSLVNPSPDQVEKAMIRNADALGLPNDMRNVTVLRSYRALALQYSSTKGEVAGEQDVQDAANKYLVKTDNDKRVTDEQIKEQEKLKAETKTALNKKKGKKRRNFWKKLGCTLGRIALVGAMITGVALAGGAFAGAAVLSAGASLGIMAGTLTVGILGYRGLGKLRQKYVAEAEVLKGDINKLEGSLEGYEENLKELNAAAKKINTRIAQDSKEELASLFEEKAESSEKSVESGNERGNETGNEAGKKAGTEKNSGEHVKADGDNSGDKKPVEEKKETPKAIDDRPKSAENLKDIQNAILDEFIKNGDKDKVVTKEIREAEKENIINDTIATIKPFLEDERSWLKEVDEFNKDLVLFSAIGFLPYFLENLASSYHSASRHTCCRSVGHKCNGLFLDSILFH